MQPSERVVEAEAGPAGRVEGSGDEHRQRRPEQRRHHDEVRRRRRPARQPVRTRRAVSRRGPQARARRGASALGPPDDHEHRDDRGELDDGERGRGAEVQAAPRSDGRSRSRASIGSGRRGSRITPNDVNVNKKTIAAAPRSAGRSAGRTTCVNARDAARAEDPRGVVLPRVEVGPEAPDDAHDDRVVEEDVGEQDRGQRRAEPERPGTPTRRRRSAARTGRRSPRGRAPGPGNRNRLTTYAAGSAITRVSSVDERGLPEREPGDAPQARVGEHLTDRAEIDVTAGDEPASEDRPDRIREEQPEEADRDRRRARPAPARAASRCHRSTVAVHSLIHRSRFAADLGRRDRQRVASSPRRTW